MVAVGSAFIFVAVSGVVCELQQSFALMVMLGADLTVEQQDFLQSVCGVDSVVNVCEACRASLFSVGVCNSVVFDIIRWRDASTRVALAEVGVVVVVDLGVF